MFYYKCFSLKSTLSNNTLTLQIDNASVMKLRDPNTPIDSPKTTWNADRPKIKAEITWNKMSYVFCPNRPGQTATGEHLTTTDILLTSTLPADKH